MAGVNSETDRWRNVLSAAVRASILAQFPTPSLKSQELEEDSHGNWVVTATLDDGSVKVGDVLFSSPVPNRVEIDWRD